MVIVDNMLFADLGISLEPVTPWSLPTVGPAAMVGVAVLLAGLTLWTYLGVTQATWRRVLIVLALRLAALALVFAMMLRPSFAMTELEGVEQSRLLVIFDNSESMKVADVAGKPTRWEHLERAWNSRDVQRRLRDLAAIEKVEVAKYLGAENLRDDVEDARADGKRTDIGAWLNQLRAKHGHEKRLRGVLVFSDGADNGTRFSAQQEAHLWRGIAPIHAFGVGDPSNAKFKKDIGVTDIKVKPTPVPVKSMLEIDAVVQAPGFKNTKVDVNVWIQGGADKEPRPFKEIKDFTFDKEKDQHVIVKGESPDEPGEYKVTLKITPHPDEANPLNNEISTYVQVIKPQVNILWVDRFRSYEPTFAIRYALAKEKERFAVYHVVLPAKNVADPHKFYGFSDRHYDVIIIGDVSAKDFSLGDGKIFDTIHELVMKKGTGLLMLGGAETFGNGGWSDHKQLMSLLPVRFDLVGDKAKFIEGDVRPLPTTASKGFPFIELEVDPKKNDELWRKHFDPLEGYTPMGAVDERAVKLLEWNKTPIMAMTQGGAKQGRVVVFAGDSTHVAWFSNSEVPSVHTAYKKFWKTLALWLSRQEDNANQLWIALDRRRISTDPGDLLGFSFGLRGKSGELLGATFTAKVMREQQEFPVQFAKDKDRQRGRFQGAKEPGEYKIVIQGKAKDGADDVQAEGVARFVVAADDIELLRPAAEHETLIRIAANAEGRFHVADEQSLVQYLDELKSQVSRESRHKTVHWPDWKRLPASESLRDQLPGIWSSFGLVSLLLFVALLGCEWGLRRWWGLV
jgi:hypothetical protein